MARAQVAILLDVDRGGATPEVMERYLKREIEKAMGRARLRTPAAPKLHTITISCVDTPKPDTRAA